MDIVKIAEETFKKFPYRIKKPDFKITNKEEFTRLLEFSPLLRHRKQDIKLTPALTAFKQDCVEIHFCPDIINSLSKSKKFIEALTMHELYHIRNHMQINTEIDALFSEDKTHSELETDFPKYAELLECY